jgi:hypothetical protein
VLPCSRSHRLLSLFFTRIASRSRLPREFCTSKGRTNHTGVRILANAVSFVEEVSSQNGEAPYSSVVPDVKILGRPWMQYVPKLRCCYSSTWVIAGEPTASKLFAGVLSVRVVSGVHLCRNLVKGRGRGTQGRGSREYGKGAQRTFARCYRRAAGCLSGNQAPL